MTIKISQNFDSGAIEVVRAETADAIDLKLRKDSHADIHQWFHFRLQGAAGQAVRMRFLNAGEATYAKGYENYNAVASYDGETWFRVPTTFDGAVMTIKHTPDTDSIYYAYFELYSFERHLRLLGEVGEHPLAKVQDLGSTVDGRDMNLVVIGQPDAPKKIWFIARQHPGESMAEWWMDGALDWLTSDAAKPLLDKATVHVVPNMNPDDTRRGHLRTNAAGVNLNREWHAPSPERSPEVLCVRNAMDETGVAFAIDVHGDEAIPANFIAGFEGIPNWTEEHGAKFYDFGRRLAAHTPDFQVEKGYEKSSAGNANLSMSTNQLAQRFGAVSVTLEMPFKDHDPNPDAEYGWSGERSKALAVSCLEVLTDMIDTI